MKFTQQLARRVKEACRTQCGGRRRVEVGRREAFREVGPDDDGLNFLRWDPDADLNETVHIDELVGKPIIDVEGWVGLDCYCYNLPTFGREPLDFLDTNVTVLIAPDGKIVYVAGVSNADQDAEIKQILWGKGVQYEIPGG